MKETYRMICCDLDGTLLDEHDRVSEKNKAAIRRCKEKGMRFAITSGRPVEPILQLIQQWGIDDLCDYVIGMNGGIVYDCKQKIKSEYRLLDGAIIKEIIEHFQDMEVRFAIFEGAVRYSDYSDEQTQEKALRYCEIERFANREQL